MDIEVQQITEDPWEYEVKVLESDLELGEYKVVMSMDEYGHYGDNVEPYELIEATIKFLLDREDPEMIMERFRLSEVERYFPEYPDEVGNYF
ncbi:MAG: hypothetical protein PHU92_03575 [Candidatus Shapirobacteria bacterium]|nr:hypothetical protein [Candidatus Shapirobacteria bacterium]